MLSSLLNSLSKEIRGAYYKKRGRPALTIPFCMSEIEWKGGIKYLVKLRKSAHISQKVMSQLCNVCQQSISIFERGIYKKEELYLYYVTFLMTDPKHFLCENAYVGYCANRTDLINKMKNSINGKGRELWDEKRFTLINQRLSELEKQKK